MGVVVCMFVLFGEIVCFLIIFYFYYFFFIFLWGGHYKGEGQIWRDREMSGIGVHDVKFPKNQLKKYA